MRSYSDKTILITGASAGLGAEFARQLAPHAKRLILVARRVERLEELKTELRSSFPQLEIEVQPVDLSRPEAEKALVEWLNQNRFSVDVLINNAGFGDLGTFATANREKIREMMMVNMVNLTSLTQALLPGIIERQGAVLNVASTAGWLPLPTFAVYAATKAYVCSFSEALRLELKNQNVAVTALCPGPVKTEFTQVASRTNSKRDLPAPAFLYVAPEKVVRDALNGLLKNKARVVPGLTVKLGIGFVDLLPIPLLRLFLSLGASKRR